MRITVRYEQQDAGMRVRWLIGDRGPITQIGTPDVPIEDWPEFKGLIETGLIHNLDIRPERPLE
jgi:hypothetical protein